MTLLKPWIRLTKVDLRSQGNVIWYNNTWDPWFRFTKTIGIHGFVLQKQLRSMGNFIDATIMSPET